MNNLGKKIINELSEINNFINASDLFSLVSTIDKSSNIFLTGVGRSGLMLRAFTNRLMHLGYNAYMIGDISTPHTKPNDILIIGSASGNSTHLFQQAEKAINDKLKIAVITANKESSLVKKADILVIIPTQTKDTNPTSLQPMGTLFEQSSLLLYDSIVLMLMEKNGETSDSMKTRHANLE
ncbi:6-phospho-3-hexuloisomerase [Pectinatus haikarae]|uniref:6-phospho-3-hexuloisomerase n=1 Tax=Pectinatus haikarae TaxID=349096 RepID=A0ABT9YAX2_9FIRM|nr:6-phospho-3-hexuloisomerase [Pectinatus haikarae]MDQ0204691.1 6-phospho-3-hexuloisomerase [Pectinatus haikarae]